MSDKCEYVYIGGMRVPMENVLITFVPSSSVSNMTQSFRVVGASPGRDRGEPPYMQTISELKKLLKNNYNSKMLVNVYDPKTKSSVGEPFEFDPSKTLGRAGRKHATKGRSDVWDQFEPNEFVAGVLAKGVSYGVSEGLDTINTLQMSWLATTPAGKVVIHRILKSSDPDVNDVKHTLAAAIARAHSSATAPLSKEDLESFAKLVPMAEALGFLEKHFVPAPDRKGVTDNPSTTVDSLHKLASDENEDVRDRAAADERSRAADRAHALLQIRIQDEGARKLINEVYDPRYPAGETTTETLSQRNSALAERDAKTAAQIKEVNDRHDAIERDHRIHTYWSALAEEDAKPRDAKTAAQLKEVKERHNTTEQQATETSPEVPDFDVEEIVNRVNHDKSRKSSLFGEATARALATVVGLPYRVGQESLFKDVAYNPLDSEVEVASFKKLLETARAEDAKAAEKESIEIDKKFKEKSHEEAKLSAESREKERDIELSIDRKFVKDEVTNARSAFNNNTSAPDSPYRSTVAQEEEWLQRIVKGGEARQKIINEKHDALNSVALAQEAKSVAHIAKLMEITRAADKRSADADNIEVDKQLQEFLDRKKSKIETQS